MIGRLSGILRGVHPFSVLGYGQLRNMSGAGRPGLPGQNFPMDFDGGKYKITAIFMVFFGVPLGAPWLVIWRQMTRDQA